MTDVGVDARATPSFQTPSYTVKEVMSMQQSLSCGLKANFTFQWGTATSDDEETIQAASERYR